MYSVVKQKLQNNTKIQFSVLMASKLKQSIKLTPEWI